MGGGGGAWVSHGIVNLEEIAQRMVVASTAERGELYQGPHPLSRDTPQVPLFWIQESKGGNPDSGLPPQDARFFRKEEPPQGAYVLVLPW